MRNKSIGILLLLVGVFLLLANFNLLRGEIFLLLLSAIFLILYFRMNRNIGFLIPGCILFSIFLFNTVNNLFNINPIHSLTFIGIGFLGIYFIHYFGKRDISPGEKYWSLYPGIILIIIGILISLIQSFPDYLRYLIPIVLIIVGVFLLFRHQK
ncbi:MULTISPECIES: hypothetical protein [Dictyoglomus]|jgi:hypothetical protein|uniref:DUF5668 domain-containing protein n=1 Tax=Dictyoglomus turgidum (strain DSM 6724 / Z-1310) TaxID=515635 RepID=B8DZK8_DICTD|nr:MULTISPECIES: hypothetical protein [Dictyoglomus]ACK41941.1 conserved hypothetical protein [Dictyoglomus turgidum DSM 6724]PNV79234.1 MAG: hypothetical protein C0196_06505 [Dictyoglomus turgidum]HBU31499.1 hypothetical protein [Dictyoglomus sp.]